MHHICAQCIFSCQTTDYASCHRFILIMRVKWLKEKIHIWLLCNSALCGPVSALSQTGTSLQQHSVSDDCPAYFVPLVLSGEADCFTPFSGLRVFQIEPHEYGIVLVLFGVNTSWKIRFVEVISVISSFCLKNSKCKFNFILISARCRFYGMQYMESICGLDTGFTRYNTTEPQSKALICWTDNQMLLLYIVPRYILTW